MNKYFIYKKLVAFLLFIIYVYPSFHYIFRYTSTATSPIYSNTPLIFQVSKYFIIFILLLLIYSISTYKTKINKFIYLIIFIIFFMITVSFLSKYMNDMRYLFFLIILFPIFFIQNNF